MIGHHVFGTLPPRPTLTSTALIASNGQALARVMVAVSLNDGLLRLIRDETPLPAEAALVLARNGRVIAGGPHEAAAVISNNRVVFGSIGFAAQAAPVGLPHTVVLAVEPLQRRAGGLIGLPSAPVSSPRLSRSSSRPGSRPASAGLWRGSSTTSRG